MMLDAKILVIAIVLAGLFFLTFIGWSNAMETAFAGDDFTADMARMKWVGWLMGLGLLVADLVLPVPATGVMSALGTVYGFWLGWLLGATGSALAGIIGYGFTRLGGDRMACRLASPRELDEFRHLFDRWGGLAIIMSRALPILPEVMAVLAGLARMRFRLFLAAMLAGTIPVAGLFAWWGRYAGAKAPGTSFIIAVMAPLGLWAMLLPVLRRHGRQHTATDQRGARRASNPTSGSGNSGISRPLPRGAERGLRARLTDRTDCNADI